MHGGVVNYFNSVLFLKILASSSPMRTTLYLASLVLLGLHFSTLKYPRYASGMGMINQYLRIFLSS